MVEPNPYYVVTGGQHSGQNFVDDEKKLEEGISEAIDGKLD